MTAEDIIELEALTDRPASIRDNMAGIEARYVLTRKLVAKMVEEDTIRFESKEADDEYGRNVYRATVRVASPNACAWFDQHQADLAQRVAEKAIAAIENWGQRLWRYACLKAACGRCGQRCACRDAQGLQITPAGVLSARWPMLWECGDEQ